MSTATRTRRTEFMALETIRVSDRHREDLGDVDALAASIEKLGLFHPVVVTGDGRLIAGERRLEAYRRLGRDTIEVRVAADLDTAAVLLEAERGETIYEQLRDTGSVQLPTPLLVLPAGDSVAA